jgi:hypothetical protein
LLILMRALKKPVAPDISTEVARGAGFLATKTPMASAGKLVETESGQNYFVEQYIKMGVFVGGSNLELVDEEEGKKDVTKLEMAIKGKCDTPHNKQKNGAEKTASAH